MRPEPQLPQEKLNALPLKWEKRSLLRTERWIKRIDMNRLGIQLKIAIILLAIFILILTGCATKKQQTKIPAQEIQGRANRAFDDLSTHETGQRRPSSFKEKRNESPSQQHEVKSKPSAVRTKKGKRPDWVDG